MDDCSSLFCLSLQWSNIMLRKCFSITATRPWFGTVVCCDSGPPAFVCWLNYAELCTFYDGINSMCVVGFKPWNHTWLRRDRLGKCLLQYPKSDGDISSVDWLEGQASQPVTTVHGHMGGLEVRSATVLVTVRTRRIWDLHYHSLPDR